MTSLGGRARFLGKASLCLLVCLALMALAGCEKKPAPPTPVGELDNPWHHYAGAMQALEEGKLDEAASKFDRSLQMDPQFSPSLGGQAILIAVRAAKHKEANLRSADAQQALARLKEADKNVKNSPERFIYQVNVIRVYTELKTKDWLKECKEAYEVALKVDPFQDAQLPYYRNRDAADYFMGMAYFKAYEFRQAENALAKVMGARAEGYWQVRANATYKKLQKIVRASSGYTLGRVSKEIAVKDDVNRGDVAAILVDELKLDKLFQGRIPVKSQVAKQQAEYTPADVMDHPFKPEILTMMKWDVRGLTPTYSQTSRAWLFDPQGPVTRKEFALTVEDLLIKLTGDEKIATKMLGNDSPFPDVPSSVAWFNACMTMVSRGVMEADLSGEFRPNDKVEGAELLLAVFKLRNVLNIH